MFGNSLYLKAVLWGICGALMSVSGAYGTESHPSEASPVLHKMASMGQEAEQAHSRFIDELTQLSSKTASSEENVLLPKQLGPVLPPILPLPNLVVPLLPYPPKEEDKVSRKANPVAPSVPDDILAVDVHPKQPRIAILIDDLGYNRQGMTSSLDLPTEVALAILPSTPFAQKTAQTAQQQRRVTLLHAPMENLRGLKLGPGGLYANMTEEELKATLKNDLDSLPGIQGVNNHMGSLLTTKANSMAWVMQTLQGRSLFFIDSLTNAKSVAKQTAQDYGLDTVSRDVFLDNIRTEKAIDHQFSRLITLAKRHGSAMAIGHPYPETTAYLKKRLANLEDDGVQLVPLSDLLISSPTKKLSP
ncbi:divergent polysaccharide deacetylase family protein [Marinomonas algarum]|uniref:Divergent polysaccharide deacetylase family protein n=1 Tax=Marinomonas algarum TaxID=2883105 RepID=A0A9X1ILY2_9GAMM|nr:divergent polysaccharide deacetylase family protein [Marinomonas algarum]MCB5161209.1 divergent polysaccharide deacetylase family protein [Marinomonas algarum]